MKDTIGEYPCDITKEGNNVVIRFHPKTEGALHPESVKFTLQLDKSDLEKISKIK